MNKEMEVCKRPARLGEWLRIALLYQLKKQIRIGRKFCRKIIEINKQDIKEKLEKWS